jgi:CDP-diacylglycerol--glycerol-3-phosphate 3-phosphatidyltransferase
MARVKHVPNTISILRICLVPVFIVAYLHDDSEIKLYAILIFAVAALSDFLDGYLARKFQASSNLGKLLDPLGDKLMTVAVMVCITIDRPILFWAVIATVVKEILMGAGGFVLHKKTNDELLPSNFLGKASTVVFFLVCVALMVFVNIPDWAAVTLISVAIGIAFLALASYLYQYIKIMKQLNAADPANAECGEQDAET